MSKVCIDINIKDLVENIYTNNKYKEFLAELGKIMEKEDMVHAFFGYGEIFDIIQLMLEFLDEEELEKLKEKINEMV
jgi:hypothetical protein